MACKFCIGNKLRENNPPSFPEKQKVIEFIKKHAPLTKLLSISGSTSDPMLTDQELLKEYSTLAKSLGLRVAIHTHANAFDESKTNILKMADKTVISAHNLEHLAKANQIIKAVGKERVRISSVCNSENKQLLEKKEFYEAVNADTFTVRLNVFEDIKLTPPYPKTGQRIFNQEQYSDGNKSVVVWDFKNANEFIAARYLWPDGQMKPQCYWTKLHEVE